MGLVRLTHSECVKLLRSPGRRRNALVAVDGRAQVVLPCFMLDDGDLLMPGGDSSAIFHAAALRPVTAEFSHFDRHGAGGWTITGMGIAYPMTYPDHRVPVMPVATRQRNATVFENGLRVRVARLTGHRTTGEPAVPRQRDGRS